MNITEYDSMLKRMEEKPAYIGYTEILRLDEMLTAAGIAHRKERLFDGWIIYYLGKRGKRGQMIGEAIERVSSYGARHDRIEVWGFNLHDPQGWLSAEEALEYFEKWEKKYGKHASN